VKTILNDLIVDDSDCFGFDCLNGENFGFDTVCFMENNLRIHFDDDRKTTYLDKCCQKNQLGNAILADSLATDKNKN